MDRKANRNKQVCCKFCGREMRSDNLEMHMKTHVKMAKVNETIENLIRQKEAHLEQEIQHMDIISHDIESPLECYEQSQAIPESVREEMLRRNDEYLEKMEMGRQVYEVLQEGAVKEGSLSFKHKEALDLFRKERSVMNVDDIQLRVWQCDLLENIKLPSEREVIWVRGTKGNEGKSWFQSYIQSLFGIDRVVRLDIKARKQDLMHALAKRPLTNADIFLFNMPRSCGETKSCSYGAIEGIKDGYATSTKYTSTVLSFKTPNVVVVFSNELPRPHQLSKDRLCLFDINANDDLISLLANRVNGSDYLKQVEEAKKKGQLGIC